MRDDDSLERFMMDNKPTVPPAPPDELRHVTERLHAAPMPRRRLLPQRAGVAMAVVAIAMAVLLVVARQPRPVRDYAAFNTEAVLADSYSTLEDTGDGETDDAGDGVWSDASVTR